MIVKFIIFLSLVLAIFLGVHYLLYYSVLRFFTITSVNLRTGLLAVLLYLSVSFFITALLLHVHVNIITSALHFVSAFWLGLMIYLLMALAAIWLVFGVSKLAGYVPDMRLVSLLFFALAVGVSVYGLWNACHPRLKNIEVEMRGLPPDWKGKTVVHLSDVHLGSIHKAGFLKRVVGQVNSLNPELMLITGDLFDGMGGDLQSFVEPLNSLKAAKGIFFCLGNHEGYLGLKKPLAILKQTRIQVLNDEVAEVDGLQIVGIGFPEFNKTQDVEAVFTAEKGFDPERPNILLYHTPTNIRHENEDRGGQQYSTYWGPDVDLSFVKARGVDLQLSGHTHGGQMFPFNYLTRLIYKGYHYGLHRDGPLYLYTTSGVGTWGPPLRVGGYSEIVVITLR